MASVAEQVKLSRFLQKAVKAYYAKGTAIGKQGDFITAPEISQVFGELIALRVLDAWQRLGEPSDFAFIELGTGRGALLADMVRVFARLRPEFLRAAHWHLLERSSKFRNATTEAVAKVDSNIRLCYHHRLATVPSAMPNIFVANEFFDALPIDQYRLIDGKWHIAMVENHQPAQQPVRNYYPTNTVPADAPTDLAANQIWHKMRVGVALMRALAKRLMEHRGFGIVIDYGSYAGDLTDGLNLIKSHSSKGAVLAEEGDLSADVDFSQLVAAARAFKVKVEPLTTQAQFLYQSGFKQRLETLVAHNPAQGANLVEAASRLVAPPMGEAFKVMVLNSA